MDQLGGRIIVILLSGCSAMYAHMLPDQPAALSMSRLIAKISALVGDEVEVAVGPERLLEGTEGQRAALEKAAAELRDARAAEQSALFGARQGATA